MSGGRDSAWADRKALLAMRAELDRQRVALAAHEIKSIITPLSVADRVARSRPLAAPLISLMGSLAGTHRFGRWLRYTSFALAALRLARDWRGRPR